MLRTVGLEVPWELRQEHPKTGHEQDRSCTKEPKGRGEYVLFQGREGTLSPRVPFLCSMAKRYPTKVLLAWGEAISGNDSRGIGCSGMATLSWACSCTHCTTNLLHAIGFTTKGIPS